MLQQILGPTVERRTSFEVTETDLLRMISALADRVIKLRAAPAPDPAEIDNSAWLLRRATDHLSALSLLAPPLR
jgi:hypothetical protein